MFHLRNIFAIFATFPLHPGLLYAESDISTRLAQNFSQDVRTVQQQLSATRSELAALPAFLGSENTSHLGWHSNFAPPAGLVTKFLQVDLGDIESFDAIALVPVTLPDGVRETVGYGFPKRFRIETANSPDFSQSTVLADYTETDFPNPGSLPVVADLPGTKARYIRITATKLSTHGTRSVFALGELMVLRGDRNLAAHRPVTASDSTNNPPAWDPANATDGFTPLGSPILNDPSPSNGYHSAIAKKPDLTTWVQIDLGREIPLDEIRLFSAAPVDFPARSGFGFPLRFRVEIGNQPDLSDATPIASFEESDAENPKGNPLSISAGEKPARYVRFTATKLWQRSNDFVCALSEMEVLSNGSNVAANAQVTASDQTITQKWNPAFLTDGFTSIGRLMPLDQWLRGLSRRRELQRELGRLEALEAFTITQTLHRLALATLVTSIILGVGIVLWMIRQRGLRERDLQDLRKRLAADLHDEIGSNLGSIALLSRLAAEFSRPPEHTRADMNEIQRIAQDTADSMRDIVWLLQPGPRSASGLVLRLRETAAQLLLGTDYSFDANDVPGPFHLEQERQLLLFFKETLNNIRKHAQAKHVRISIQQRGADFQLRVIDDGVGFDSTLTKTGLGLDLLQQRAKTLAGKFQITTSPGKGTQVELTFQLP
ncbi:MAG: ATP-binding protein [Verrucomicrobiota bacterium]